MTTRFLRIFYLCLPLCVMSATVRAEDPPTPKDRPKTETPAAADKPGADDQEDKNDKKKKKPDVYFALKGGTVHTVTEGDRHGITVLARNGRIIAMAEHIDLPPGTEVLDTSGHHIYPGLVAVNSGGILGAEPPDDSTNVYSLQMTLALAGGITTAVSGNTAGKISYGDVSDMILKRDLFHTLRYARSEPNARRELRGKFEKVRQYLRDLRAYEENKKLDPKAAEPDKEWLKGEYESCLKLLKRETVAVLDADTAIELLDACDLATRYGIDVVVRGAYEGWTVAPELARARISAVITPRRTVTADDELNRSNGSSIENAAILHRHGVPIAIVPQNTAITLWGLGGRDLLHLNMEAAFGVRGGLSNEAALRAITIDAARILGVADRVGSIEIGKDADFAITDGDILHYMTHVRWTVVNGRVAYDKNKDTLFSHIRPDGNRDAPPPDDHWPRELGADQ